MAEKKSGGAGLRGQVAGKSAICTVAMGHSGLTYFGYEVDDLADNCQFEEVAYLLFNGELPTTEQLQAYKERLAKLRDLPATLKEVLERIPASAHPMDVMRTGVSFLGNLEIESRFRRSAKCCRPPDRHPSGHDLLLVPLLARRRAGRIDYRRRINRRTFSPLAA